MGHPNPPSSLGLQAGYLTSTDMGLEHAQRASVACSPRGPRRLGCLLGGERR